MVRSSWTRTYSFQRQCEITDCTLLRIDTLTFEFLQGEKPIIALINPAASARMAVAESLMNIAASDLLDGLKRIRLSCNWMTAIVRIDRAIFCLLVSYYESQNMP